MIVMCVNLISIIIHMPGEIYTCWTMLWNSMRMSVDEIIASAVLFLAEGGPPVIVYAA